MKGTYCLIIQNPRNQRIRVGALGKIAFPAGAYVYVGSALGGIEKRVERHLSKKKLLRWHIDFLLAKADVISTLYVPSQSKGTECDVAKALLACEGASSAARRFGSSDCDCDSHLIFFGDVDTDWVAETLSMCLSMLSTVYPRTC
jgi:sugar fermentation stimulation protein A